MVCHGAAAGCPSSSRPPRSRRTRATLVYSTAGLSWGSSPPRAARALQCCAERCLVAVGHPPAAHRWDASRTRRPHSLQGLRSPNGVSGIEHLKPNRPRAASSSAPIGAGGGSPAASAGLLRVPMAARAVPNIATATIVIRNRGHAVGASLGGHDVHDASGS